jgi:hypothetical protein
MGTIADHKRKWLHNRKFIATIDPANADWMVVAAFYTAIHAIEALFSKDRVTHEGSHSDRNFILRTRQRYHSIWQPFRLLYEASLPARYDCAAGPGDPDWISAADVKRIHIEQDLYAVERLVARLLSFPSSEFPPLFPPP